MVEQTDYKLLTIVAVVAVVAILAMLFASQSTGASTFSIAQATLEPTGNYIAAEDAFANKASVRVSAEYTGEGDWDIDGDGDLGYGDLEALGTVINGGDCPSSKDCDVNNDNSVDIRDAGALQQTLYREGVFDEHSVPRALKPVAPADPKKKINDAPSIGAPSALA